MSAPTAVSPPRNPLIIDDKSPHCIPFILRRLEAYSNSTKPLILGLNGIQGAGKTTLVSSLAATLSSPPHNLPTLVLSIDDLYLPHAAQQALAAEHPDNKLVQHRGEPGTHDVKLAKEVFERLIAGEETKVPAYDKSAFNGQGDRVDEVLWQTVNKPGEPKIHVVIFEGWCVGFRALSERAIEAAYNAPSRTLHQHTLAHLMFVNESLKAYDVLTDSFDALIHIDAVETEYVYAWRQEQEAVMRREKGRGMTSEEVDRFVDGYYPAYELYTGKLREGFVNGKGRQLRLVVGRDRKVRNVFEL